MTSVITILPATRLQKLSEMELDQVRKVTIYIVFTLEVAGGKLHGTKRW